MLTRDQSPSTETWPDTSGVPLTSRHPRGGPSRSAVLVGFVVFLSAFLLFQVQLIVAKHLLPWFGGTPAVWTTSQMFFQVSLLGGYAYAHVLTTLRQPWLQFRIHLVLLAAAVIAVFAIVAWGGVPLLAPGSLKPAGTEAPVSWLLLILLTSAGLPFFAVSTTGPLLQKWHSRQSTSLSQTYRLYGLSNAGSFLALLSYPFLFERALDLSQQGWLWAALFVLFACGCAMVAWRSAHYPELPGPVEGGSGGLAPAGVGSSASRAGAGGIAAWLLLTFTSSVMFLATTNQLSQDVAAIPFLWVLPLAIYLLTFIICFDRPHWYSRRWIPLAAALASIAILPVAAVTSVLRVPVQVVAYSGFLFCFCLLCHGELVRLRPGARHLTLFYLVIALGGALGGTFVSIGAPALFPDFWEFHSAILAGWIVIAFAWRIDRTSPFHTGDPWLFGSLVAIVFSLAARYVVERTRLGEFEWISRHSWTITLVGGMAIAIGICAIFRKSRIAHLSLWPQGLVVLMILFSGMFLLQRIEVSQYRALYAARNFYGVIRVVTMTSPAGDARQLLHGTTSHGVQVNIPAHRNRPTAYYSQSSGIAVASTRLIRKAAGGLSERPAGLHFGVVGMGVGTMSTFAGPADRVRYYEINPEVIDIVQREQPYFTYVKDSPAEAAIVLGDARLSLERELAASGSQRFDLLAMDAFSSDSVPVHLVTLEAFRLYAAHLKTSDSILAVNVTNRYLDLEPVVAAGARELGFHGVRVDSPGDPPVVSASSWILLARNPRIFEHPAVQAFGGRPLRDRFVPFTDQYSNLFSVLK